MDAPKTLQEAIIYFADSTNCNSFLTELRWADGKVRCHFPLGDPQRDDEIASDRVPVATSEP